MKRILPPEVLFKRTDRKLVKNIFEKVEVEFKKSVNLGDLAERLEGAEYMAEGKSNGLKIPTRLGTIMVYAKSAQLVYVKDPNCIAPLSSFLHYAIHSTKPTSFIDWKQSLPWREKGWLGDLITNLEKTIDDVKKIVRM